MTIEFSRPEQPPSARVHHSRAAAGNAAVADEAGGVLRDALSGDVGVERILLKAAAGAGKSFVLSNLVEEAVAHPDCVRVAVVAFTNKQIRPLAKSLGSKLGRDRVCLFVAKDRVPEVPADIREHATVVGSTTDIPPECTVVVSTSHKLGAFGEANRLRGHFGPSAHEGFVFDVLFVDEAWQLPHHLFAKVANIAPITVGVGDVGQLPPLEVGTNPWRGDPGYNPYRAWPTAYDGDEHTWSRELPAVWRPTAEQLDLWRAFYPKWGELHCVAAPKDRRLVVHSALPPLSSQIWAQVGTGVPTMLEVDGLREAEAADVDLPLMEHVEKLLADLFSAGFALEQADYDGSGTPTGTVHTRAPGSNQGDPLITILATRNQAVDDATDLVDRLRAEYSLTETDLVASTVDSWQGQTNGITIAVHPLNSAVALDEFNSAFGRLAVTCTRATHGLLMVTRPGLGKLLGESPARPGTPFGEPGNRQLPRQTHQRILETFARATVRP